jgi:hypothetical protein
MTQRSFLRPAVGPFRDPDHGRRTYGTYTNYKTSTFAG